MHTWKRLRTNPALIERYLIREKVTDGIRAFFKAQQFHECETPILVPTPSCESNLEFFETTLTTHSGESRQAFLISSPEYALKKLLVAGLGDIFEITKVFRNEENISRQHNHEFTMLEWYRAEADYTKIMTDCEELICSLVPIIQPTTALDSFIYQNQKLNLSPPWLRLSVPEAFHKYAHIDLETLLSDKGLKHAHQTKGYQQDHDTTWEQAFYQILFNEIEPELNRLSRPVFLYDYPVAEASLSRQKKSDPRLAERFELFIGGLEIGNAFSELNDATEQETRLNADLALRKRLHKTSFQLDHDFISALKLGMPEAAGIAVGVDRLVMLLADAPTIADTLFFPVAEMFDLR